MGGNATIRTTPAPTGYMVVQRSYRGQTYIAWVRADTPIERLMTGWIEGLTTEILEYVPGVDPDTDVTLIPTLNLWTDHMKEMRNAQAQT